MKEGSWRKRAIPATSIAMLGYCETKLVLQRKHGDRASPAQAQARERGVREHARFHATVVAHHNPATARDSRCFIATAVFGYDDPRTHALRVWRDRRLVPTPAGRLLVKLYYWTSPPLARFLLRHPAISAATGKCLEAFVTRCRGTEQDA